MRCMAKKQERSEQGGRAHVSADVRREQLAAAALRVMKREGISAATTRAITAEADMPHGVFHYCFRSKQELFTSLLDNDINVPLDEAWDVVSPGVSAEDGFKALFRSYWGEVESDHKQQLVLNELTAYALRDEKLKDLPGWEHGAYRKKIIHHLERFGTQANLSFRIPVDELAELILAALAGVTNSWLTHQDNDVARCSLDRYAELFATYLESKSDSNH